MSANNDRMESKLANRANKSVNAKVKKYVLGPLMEKIDQAGEMAPIFIEQLERDVMEAKPEGYFIGFEKDDFIELKKILSEMWDN